MALPNLIRRIFSEDGYGESINGSIIPYSTDAPIVAGTASAGSQDMPARADHVHPAQDATYVVSATRSAVLAANKAFTVPSYIVGSGRLQVYLDGVLCAGGSDTAVYTYVEVGTAGAASTSIKFHQAIPVDMEIIARVQ